MSDNPKPQILFVLCERLPCDKTHPDAELVWFAQYFRWKDSWQPCETMEEAEKLYAEAIARDETFIANIVVCIKSTDYDALRASERLPKKQ